MSIRFLILFVLTISLLGCKSSKKVIKEETNQKKVELTQTSLTKTISGDNDFREVIIETIETTKRIIQDPQTGNYQTVPITTATRKIERFDKSRKEEIEETLIDEIKEETTEKIVDDKDKQVDGSNIPKSVSKGVVEGIGKVVFGDLFKYLLAGLILFILVLILGFKYVFSNKDKQDTK